MVSELPPAVARLIDAANSHDIEAFLASFTEDGVVDDWGREFAGSAAIRGWSDREFIGVDVILTLIEIARSDDQTIVSAEVGGKGYNGSSHFTFTLRDGLVSRMNIRE